MSSKHVVGVFLPHYIFFQILIFFSSTAKARVLSVMPRVPAKYAVIHSALQSFLNKMITEYTPPSWHS